MAKNKNPGPLLTSIVKGILEVWPARWRSKLAFTTTEQKVNEDVTVSTITGDLIASAVLQDQTNERKKINVTIEDPTNITMTEKAMMDGPADAIQGTRNLTVVTEGAALPAATYLTLSQNQDALGNGKAIQTVESVTGYTARPGQTVDEETGVVTSFVRTVIPINTELGGSNKKITPIDHLRAEKEEITVNTSALNAFFVSGPGIIEDLDLPTELLELNVRWSESESAGDYTSNGLGAADASGDQVMQVQAPGRGNAQGSASFIPTVAPKLRRKNGRNIPCRECFFYIPENTTLPTLLAKLTTKLSITVENWPSFTQETYTFTCIGQKVSASAQVECYVSISKSTTSASFMTTEGGGTSYDVADSLRDIVVGPCINEAINLTDTIRSADALAACNCSIVAGPYAASRAAAASKSAFASIEPIFIPATSPSAIPTSGTYLHRYQTRLFKPGWLAVRAYVFSASDITG